MKTVVFNRPTKDVDGLLVEFRKVTGPVISVASDHRNTYVYMDDDSSLDLSAVMREWEDVPAFRVESMNRAAADGIPIAAADGVDTHTIIIQKTNRDGDVIQGRARVFVSSAQPVKVSRNKVKLEGGVASITVGPSVEAGDVILDVRDPMGKIPPEKIAVRFVLPQGNPKPAAGSTGQEGKPLSVEAGQLEGAEESGVWSKIKAILGF
jgi:hypothetical protein